jgi:hypothetical protein
MKRLEEQEELLLKSYRKVWSPEAAVGYIRSEVQARRGQSD